MPVDFLMALYMHLSGANQESAKAPSVTYEVVLDTAARHMYDPSSLGNLDRLKQRFQWQVHSEADAVKFANEALRESGDPFNTVISIDSPETKPVTAVKGTPAIKDKLLANGIAYIQLKDFSHEKADILMKNALEKHAKAQGFILDLRGNAGGRVDKALLMSSMFIDRGKLLTLQERTAGDPRNPNYVTVDYELGPNKIEAKSKGGRSTSQPLNTVGRLKHTVKKPVVILVDSATASAAEIFAGALQENGHAVVVGKRTFGKGVAQKVFDKMPGGARLQVTSAAYYTPKGKWLGDGQKRRNGIRPDVEVENSQGAKPCSDKDEQLKAAMELLMNNQVAMRPNRSVL